MIKHSSVVNYTHNNEKGIMRLAFDMGYSRIVSVTNLVFDICVTEIILPLVNGMTTYIANHNEQEVVKNFEELILKHKIEILQTTPSRMKLFLVDSNRTEYLKQLKFIMLGGEKVDATLIRQLKQYTEAVIENVYGPTETTVWSTSSVINDLNEDENITIGKPIANTQVYILDGMKLCAIDEKGELCISGDGLAKGYLNLPELTEKKFVDNPFGDGKLYRTGDMASWREDGNINFFGRIDDQIKIRGFRIELGEIENVIRKIDEVKDVVVVARDNKSDDREINAYIISDNSAISKKVREELKSYLPEYMIPAKIVKIDQFPINANDKVDREALPEIKEINKNGYVPPTTPLEEEMVELWKDMLLIDSIGIDDNFLELGGHSLIASKMAYRINENYNINLSMVEFLTQGLTVRTLSQVIEEKLFDSISEEELAALLSEIDD
jgi:acyl-coenzyme A synthetase/AMP-(fatty) acid ligase/acyl carrier protein